MKKILFILGIVLIFASPLYAELYSCKDSQGNAIVTSSPQDGMTDCTLKDSYEDKPAPEVKQTAKSEYEERAQKQKERFLERERINKCESQCSQEEHRPCKKTCFNTYGNDRMKQWEDCVIGCNQALDHCKIKCKEK